VFRWGNAREKGHMEDLGENIEIDLQKGGWGSMEWIVSVHDRNS